MSLVAFPVLWKDSHERGVQGIVELDTAGLPKGAQVGDLFPLLNAKINAQFPIARRYREVERFLLYGARVSRQRTVDALIPELASSLRFVAIMRACPTNGAKFRIMIKIKTLTNKTIQARCQSTDTVGDVKAIIQAKEGIAVDNQILVYAGNQLENHLALSMYGIKSQSQLYLSQKMRGGGLPTRIFADVSNKSILTEVDFSSEGPEWRTAAKGLNVEGRCLNRTCEAYLCMVIHPMRYEAFNLMQDEIQCPMCEAMIEPCTCGFYDCLWKFEGLQTDGCSIISKWKSAVGNKYYRFNADELHGSVEWENLLISVRPREKVRSVMKLRFFTPTELIANDECMICWCALGAESQYVVATVGCGHSFHGDCIAKWSEWCEDMDVLPSCPTCRSVV